MEAPREEVSELSLNKDDMFLRKYDRKVKREQQKKDNPELKPKDIFIGFNNKKVKKKKGKKKSRSI